jgi:DNA topoisomerase IA
MKLILVESPAHARAVSAALGTGWRVESCNGPLRRLSLATQRDDSLPTFVLLPGKANLVRRLKRAVQACEVLVLALPPGRAGDLLAWHAVELLDADIPIRRIALVSLTPDAIRAAVASPRDLDARAAEAAAAEQVLLSQSPGLIRTGAQTWTAQVTFTHHGTSFLADVRDTRGRRVLLGLPDQRERLNALLLGSRCVVERAAGRVVSRPAPAPYDTASMIADAGGHLGLAPQRTLALLGTLFDAGWIMHPEADLQPTLGAAAQRYIVQRHGPDLAAADTTWLCGIAPADIDRLPADLPGDGAALYGLIWRRFIAAHMAAGQDRLRGMQIQVLADGGRVLPLRLTVVHGTSVVAGWRCVLPSAEKPALLPDISEGMMLAAESVEFAPVEVTPADLVARLIRAGLSPQAALSAAGRLNAGTAHEIDPAMVDVIAGIGRIAAGDLTLADWGQSLRACLDEGSKSASVSGKPEPILLRPITEVAR